MKANGTLLMLISALIFSTTAVFTRIVALDGIHPFWIVEIRTAIATAFFAILILSSADSRKGSVTFFTGKDKPALKYALIAAFCFFINLICYSFALKFATASAVSVLINMSPVFAVLFSFVVGADLINRSRIFGAVISSAGAAIVVFQPGNTSGNIEGYISAIGSAIVWSLFVVYSAKAMRSCDRNVLNFVTMAFCAIACIPLALLSPWQASFKGIAYVAVLGILNTGIVYVIYQKGLKETGPVAASILTTVSPIFTVALDFVMLGIVPSPLFVAGAGMVIMGILLCKRCRS
ncbi:MAG: DMT family transporter [Candidatus Thermoplasmatota archaeon]|nr:DMT family transporter [Candidatus Thermoplasmatota archaeon]